MDCKLSLGIHTHISTQSPRRYSEEYTQRRARHKVCVHAGRFVLNINLLEETGLSEGVMFYRLTEKLTKENVILFNKLEADLIFYHFRQAVQEGYITEVRFFLPCHVEI